MRFGWIVALACCAASPAAFGQVGTGADQMALATYQGKPYDAAANCLMKEIRSGNISAWPLVYAPPRTEAIVNVWPRGREHEAPIGIFHIRQDNAGATSISFEERPGAGLSGKARAAAERCAR